MALLSTANPVYMLPLRPDIFRGRTRFGRGPDFNIMERGTATNLIIRAIRSSPVLRSVGDLRSWPTTILSQISGCFGKRRARGLDTLGEAQPNPSPLLHQVVVITRTGLRSSLRRIRGAGLSYQIQADRESIRAQHFFVPTVA